MEENQRQLYIACEASQGNFMVPNSRLFREMNSFLFTGAISQFLGI